jgi:hypothetical protein
MLQYIETKNSKEMKVYLDTNIIFGFFKSMLQNIFEGRRLKKSCKLSILFRNKKLQIYLSTFTLVEVEESIREWLNEKK